MEIKKQKSSAIRPTLSEEFGKRHRRSRLPKSTIRSVSSGLTSKEQFQKLIKSMTPRRKDRYKNRNKQTKEKSSNKV